MSDPDPIRIFMPLLDEGTDVWCPVDAQRRPDGTYLVLGTQPDDECWRFGPGSSVRCETRKFADGTTALAAVSWEFTWISVFRVHLRHLADEEWQQTVWLGHDPRYFDGPVESMSEICDGLYIEDVLSGKYDVGLKPAQMGVMRSFMALYLPCIDAWPDHPNLPLAQEVLADPKWPAIVAAAKVAEAAFARIDRDGG